MHLKLKICKSQRHYQPTPHTCCSCIPEHRTTATFLLVTALLSTHPQRRLYLTPTTPPRFNWSQKPHSLLYTLLFDPSLTSDPNHPGVRYYLLYGWLSLIPYFTILLPIFPKTGSTQVFHSRKVQSISNVHEMGPD